jgi:hypothetical protein
LVRPNRPGPERRNRRRQDLAVEPLRSQESDDGLAHGLALASPVPARKARTLALFRHRGALLIRNRAPLGPYSRTLPRALGGPSGEGRFLVRQVQRINSVWGKRVYECRGGVLACPHGAATLFLIVNLQRKVLHNYSVPGERVCTSVGCGTRPRRTLRRTAGILLYGAWASITCVFAILRDLT